jgi:hypothetical protein
MMHGQPNIKTDFSVSTNAVNLLTDLWLYEKWGFPLVLSFARFQALAAV